MEPDVQERGLRGLLRRVGEAERAGDFERRHEVLVERAIERDGLEREAAESIYALAEEEHLEPELALLVAASGVGVMELEEPDSDPERIGHQQVPPEWVAEGDIPVPEARRERRLRLTFRRLRSLLARTDSATEAVRLLAAEPDVSEGVY